MTKLKSWRGILAALSVTAVALGVLVPAAPSNAVSATDFDPGRIISDELFYDGNAMSAVDVQAFLNARAARCVIGDPGYEAGKAWGGTKIANVCARGFSMSTTTKASNLYCAAYAGMSGESAAQIISKVGKACGISQKVLLVMLEKEQSLVTDTWPTVRQFDVAMGYACPDSGPGNSANCDATYSGFFNQVYRAAWQLQVYKGNPNSYRYKPFQTNTIQWHPNTGCGASQVYIQNWATAALYIYTPYRPNQAALSAGWGTGDGCSTYGNRNFFLFYNSWFGSTGGAGTEVNPLGGVETITPGPGQAKLVGWAFDPETAGPISIHAYVGGRYESGARWGGAYVADRSNAYVNRAYPSYGPSHGFEFSLGGITTPTAVCLYAINVGRGENTLIDCPVISPASGVPFGNFEGTSLSGLKAKIQGWVVDPDDVGSVTVNAYVGGPYGEGRWGGQFIADSSRTDVGRAYPLYGSGHGLQAELSVGVGTTPICLYAMDRQTVGASSFIGCKSVSTASGPPFGNLESTQVGVGVAKVSGWAIDPDIADSISLHVYVDGRWGGAYTANAERRDVGRAYPGYGDLHGFEINLADRLMPGSNNVCVYGINSGEGYNSLLGCRQMQLPGGLPFGSLDSVSSDGSNANVSGWLIDPDTSDPVAVHAYVNGAWGGVYVADASRPDVGRAYPGYGDNHGVQVSVPLRVGSNQVCIYAINVGAGSTNPLLGCRLVNR